MVNKAGWFVTVTWARAELTKDAFITAETMMRAVRSVSKVGVAELDKSGDENVLLCEGVEKTSRRKEVS